MPTSSPGVRGHVYHALTVAPDRIPSGHLRAVKHRISPPDRTRVRLDAALGPDPGPTPREMCPITRWRAKYRQPQGHTGYSRDAGHAAQRSQIPLGPLTRLLVTGTR